MRDKWLVLDYNFFVPTIYREGPYRFFFNSREETRMHVHVETADGNAKFWLEPISSIGHVSQAVDKRLESYRSNCEGTSR